MSHNISDFIDQEPSMDPKAQFKRLWFRIVPYTPIIILLSLIGIAGAYTYLRYTTSIYATNAKVIVNDDTQQKNSNLLEVMKLDTRNLSSETEREIEILKSKDLIGNLVSKLQLNVQYSEKGFVKSGESFKNLPFKLELEHPDSVFSTIKGEVEIINNSIRFDGILYPVDSFVKSPLGKIRWHINKDYPSSSKNNAWFVSVNPITATVSAVQNSLTIEPISKQSSILVLTYIDPLPERGLNILKSLISLYGTTAVDFKSRISENTLRFLDDRLRLVSDELSGVEKNLQSFKTTQGIVDLGAEGTLFLNQAKETDTKIGELDVQIDVINKIDQYVSRRNNNSSTVPATLGINDPVLNNLLTQLYQSEFELEKLKQVSGSKNPQVEVYEDAIARLKPSISASLNNLKMGMLASRQSLQGDNSKLNATLGKIPQKERLLLDISRQQGIKNAIYTFLLQKREESAIAAAAILPNYRVIEKPEFAGIVAPVKRKVYGIGLLAALIVAFLFVYIKEFLNSRLKFRDQIENRVTVPVIAELSFEPHEPNNPIVVGDGNRSLVGEQFRELRTNLYFATNLSKEKSKVILVTSSIPGEGKSFVTINTAVSLSITGARVVILEFDLRKPKISKELGIARDPGLSSYLINKVSEKDIIKPHPTVPNFSIIPSGPIPPNPAELISSPRLMELMDYLKQHFDYILIDSPPVSAVTDAKILAKVADATLYIIRHDYTGSSYLQLINDVQKKNILPHMYIVFNGITTKKILGYNYGQGYGYGYGQGYGYAEESVKEKKGSSNKTGV